MAAILEHIEQPLEEQVLIRRVPGAGSVKVHPQAVLRVQPEQALVVVRRGKVLGTLGPGTHVLGETGFLDSDHLDQPVSLSFLFVNRRVQPSLGWSLSRPLPIRNPGGKSTLVEASGRASVRVGDPERLVTAMLGRKEPADRILGGLESIMNREAERVLSLGSWETRRLSLALDPIATEVRLALGHALKAEGVDLVDSYVDSVEALDEPDMHLPASRSRPSRRRSTDDIMVIHPRLQAPGTVSPRPMRAEPGLSKGKGPKER